MDDPMIFAHGQMFALMASLLDRAGVVRAEEFGRLTEMLSDQNPNAEQSVILAIWADCIKGIAK